MKDTKRQHVTFSFFDHTHAEAHLERMAQKGWMLESMGDSTYTYRRAEPKKLCFTVCYAPKASAFDPDLTDEQREFIDFCDRTGWRFVASNAKMQVFCNERCDPVPIHTDPMSELDSLHKAARTYIRFYAAIIALALWQVLTLLGEFRHDPIEVLASRGSLMRLGSWTWFVVFFGVELAVYLLWRKRALRSAEDGVFLKTPNLMRFERVMGIFVTAQLIFWMIDLALSGDRRLALGTLAGALYTAVVILGVRGTRDLLKRRGVSRDKNRAVTLAVDVVLVVGGMALLAVFAFRVTGGGSFERSQKQDIPLTMSDLFDVDEDNYYYSRYDGGSLLLSKSDRYCRINYHGWSEYRREPPDSIPEGYECTVVDVKAPFLRDFCRDALMRRQGRSAAMLEIEWDMRRKTGGNSFSKLDETVVHRAVDAVPWGADEAWRIYAGAPESEAWKCWLLRYGNRFVQWNPGWEPTTEQMAVIGAKLCEG